MENFNILTVDSKIQQQFSDERAELPNYKQQVKQIDEILAGRVSGKVRQNIKQDRERLLEKIRDLEEGISLHFYLAESTRYIEAYNEQLRTPIRASFMGRAKIDRSHLEKITQDYITACRQYMNKDDIEKLLETCDISEDRCECGNSKDFDLDDNILSCQNCGRHRRIAHKVSTYSDNSRIGANAQKYCYEKYYHLRDKLRALGARQNCTIPQEIYDKLEEQLDIHGILRGNKDTPKLKRFANVTREHIQIFLKDLGFVQHYENLELIFTNMTGQNPICDISHLEDKILADFVTLLDLFEKRYCGDQPVIDEVYLEYSDYIHRKKFINTPYILYQLLRKHRYPVSRDSLGILKTIERLHYANALCERLFDEMGWPGFSPVL